MLPLWMSLVAIGMGISLLSWGFADSSELYWKIRATKYISGISLVLLGGTLALTGSAS